MQRKVKHDVKVTFVTGSGVEITRTVVIEGSRNRGEARARVAQAVKAYIPVGATPKAVSL